MYRIGALRASCKRAVASYHTSACVAAAPNAKPSGSGFAKSEAGLQELYARAVEPKPVAVEALPAAELAANKKLGSTYVKLMWKRHHLQGRDLQRKLDLKWAAIAALPTLDRRREALYVNPSVPLWSRIPTETPPLSGFAGDNVPELTESSAPASGAASSATSAAGGKGKAKNVTATSLAAALRRGRGRADEEEMSLFGNDDPFAPAASEPAKKKK